MTKLDIMVERNVLLLSLLSGRYDDFKRLVPVFTKHTQDEWPSSAEAYVESNEDWMVLRKVAGEVPLTKDEEFEAAAFQLKKNAIRAERKAAAESGRETDAN